MTLEAANAIVPAMEQATTLFGDKLCYTLSDSHTLSNIETFLMANGLYYMNAVYLVLGFVLLVAGVKLMRFITILTGFVTGALGVLYIFQILKGIDANLEIPCLYMLMSTTVAGIVFAFMAYLIVTIVYPILAAGLGAGIGYLLYSAVLQAIPAPIVLGYSLVYWCSLIIPAIVSIVIFRKYKDNVKWIATSFGGAFLIVYASFGFVTLNQYSFPGYSQYPVMSVVCGLIVLLTMLGMALQYSFFIRQRPHTPSSTYINRQPRFGRFGIDYV